MIPPIEIMVRWRPLSERESSFLGTACTGAAGEGTACTGAAGIGAMGWVIIRPLSVLAAS
jgi:hypothetical protein